MTDPRRKAAEEWCAEYGEGWSMKDYVRFSRQNVDLAIMDAHIAGQECGEKREREAGGGEVMGGTCHRCGLYWSALRTDGLCIKCWADAHYSLASKPIPAIGESVDTVRLHMSNGVKQGEQRILDKLREAVNEECSCGGCGPDDPKACQACMVWHRVTGGEG